MNFIIYHFLIRLYVFAIKVASLFNPKAHEWINGRKNWKAKLSQMIPFDKKVIWMHCASLGEFEQGRPVFEALKKSHPQAFFLLTFFSPSGYLVRKEYEMADFVTYLPADYNGNARHWIQLVKPHVCIFVKYEVWPGYMKAIQESKTNAILISARFLEKAIYFRSYGRMFKNALLKFQYIFLQDEDSFHLLQKNGFTSISLAGDTRFDRVVEAKNKAISLPDFSKSIAGRRVIVAGSVWPNDLPIIFPLKQADSGYFYIIVPHEVNEDSLRKIQNLCPPNTFRLSELTFKEKADVIIIDKIGLLLQLYSIAHLAYVGGGFGKGIHNTLEAAVWGKPIVCGPNFQSFTEARALHKLNCLFEVNSSNDFNRILEKLEDFTLNSNIKSDCHTFVHSHAGATTKILSYINQNSLI